MANKNPKTKALISIGRREFEILNYISKNQPLTFTQIDKALNLNNGGTFSKKLLNLGLIEKEDKQYKTTSNGEWFVNYVYDSPKVLNRLKD